MSKRGVPKRSLLDLGADSLHSSNSSYGVALQALLGCSGEPIGDGDIGLTQTPHGLLRYRSRAFGFLRRVSKRGDPKCPLVDLGAGPLHSSSSSYGVRSRCFRSASKLMRFA